MKRYAIVRVDNSCPAMLDDFGCIVARNMLYCKCGEDTKNYGDTKEQLIKKIMTAFKIAIKKNKEGKFIKEKSSNRQVAEIIVEFLGVE